MARLLPWNFLEQFGYESGSKGEATHYSTIWNENWVLLVREGVTYYWNGYWKKTTIFDDGCLTPIGEKEPSYKVGPPAPPPEKKIVERIYKSEPTEIYPRNSRSNFRGD